VQVSEHSFIAPAKVNLRLKVVGRRADGMHLLSMLNTDISLFDQLKLKLTENSTERHVSVVDESFQPLDLGPSSKNLALRAAEAFFQKAGINNIGINIELSKHIPVGAGLGGGSSDAAAVLQALSALYPQVAKDCSLEDIAESLGSDVAYFLKGGLCRVEGAGELISKIDRNPLSGQPFLLISPLVHVSTVEVYREFARLHQNIIACKEIISENLTYSEIYNSIENDLSEVVYSKAKVCSELIIKLSSCSKVRACVTGSGSSLFCLPKVAGDIDSLEAIMAQVSELDTDIPIKLRILEFL
jgi:4-diphosphocytidyl-2-C-methyl-D-erythritol kinase